MSKEEPARAKFVFQKPSHTLRVRKVRARHCLVAGSLLHPRPPGRPAPAYMLRQPAGCCAAQLLCGWSFELRRV